MRHNYQITGLWVSGSHGLMVGGYWTSALYFGDFYAEGMHNGPEAQISGSRLKVSSLISEGSRITADFRAHCLPRVLTSLLVKIEAC